MTTKVILKDVKHLDATKARRVALALKKRGMTADRILELRAAVVSGEPLTKEVAREILTALETYKQVWWP